MALRLIEMFVPSSENPDSIRELLKDYPILGIWHQSLSEDSVLVKMLLEAEQTEDVLDFLEQRFSGLKGFRIVLLPVEASLPRPEEQKKEESSLLEKPISEKEQETKGTRISREELYTDIVETTKLSSIYVVLVILSSTVAAVGILRNNVAVIIGAMVIAPLLGPNIALSFATTLGDMDLVRKALKTNLAGLFIALVFSVSIGFIFKIDPSIPELASRTQVGLGDVVLALASGSAGVLSFTTGVAGAIIGVMVAVALLPPLVSFGMLLGSKQWEPAFGAMTLLLVNVICVNLAGVLTFLIQGIRPKTWWEEDRAKKATRNAIALWTFLLLILLAVIYFSI
ncbi:hypothetical protein HRbin37_01677 [bacterium HR37]|nr:hypothetical protein HRbin37_01677 [bacterium HR37]